MVSSGEVSDSLDVAVDIAARIVPSGTAVLSRVEAFADGVSGRELAIHSGRTSLLLRVHFASDPELPCPSVAVGFAHANGMVVSSAGSANDGVVLKRDAAGFGFVELTFERLPLLKGDYTVSVILGCERGLHVYEVMERVIQLRVVQQDLEQGLVKMPHRWTIE